MGLMRRLERLVFETPLGTLAWTTLLAFLVMAFFSACTGKRLDLATFMLCPLLGGFHAASYLLRVHTRRQRTLEGERLAAELPWNKGAAPKD